jgi:thymidylate synthase
MKNYLELGRKILSKGELMNTRSGPTRSLTGQILEFDLEKGFPLLTTKWINFDHIKYETIWYLKGTGDLTYLHDHKIKIWDNWAKDNNIGKTYGYQWRSFNDDPTLGDQYQAVLTALREDPSSRRIIINGWNPLQLSEMQLPPCLVMLHFLARSDQKLDLVVYQRSADFCLGVPYDIAEMAFLTHIVAQEVGMIPGKLTICYGDVHIYENHVQTFLTEQYKNKPGKLPTLKTWDIDLATMIQIQLDPEQFELMNYVSAGKIKYPISV